VNPKALIVCLLLGGGCAASPPPRDPRAEWMEKIRPLRPSWGRKEVHDFLEALRGPAPHLDGGGFQADRGPTTYFDLYTLDETFALYVAWKDLEARNGIRSTEIVAFPDLRNRIDPDLYEAVAAIHRSPSPQRGLQFSPLRMVRAVNALQPLGKEKALKALRAYERLARELSVEQRRKYLVEEDRILPIVHLLFEGKGRRLPGFLLGAGDVAPPPGGAWPLFPIVLVQDVPFMMVSGYVLNGVPQGAADHLRLDLGPVRADPLAPRVPALEAADELTQSDAWASLRLGPGNEGRKRWMIRRQALDAVSSVFRLRPEESSNDCCVDPTETQWRAAVARAGSSGLIWSPELQDFILGR